MNLLRKALFAGTMLFSASAQPIVVNGSFEADGALPPPGYGPISGWMMGGEGGTGYGLSQYPGDFADNGAMPDGGQVAFLQDNGTLSQTISGFIVGQRYWLGYFENARGLCCGERTATISVTVHGASIVPEHIVAIAFASNPYRFVLSAPFTATQTEQTIVFTKGGVGDSTALLDAVQIFDDLVRLDIQLRNDFTPEISIEGAPGSAVLLEYTHSLTLPDWQPAAEKILADGFATFVDTVAPADAPRFYRAKRL